MTFSIVLDQQFPSKFEMKRKYLVSCVVLRRVLSKLFYDNNDSLLSIVGIAPLHSLIKKLLEEHYVHFLIIITSDSYIQSLNLQYRNKNQPTDVLTFNHILNDDITEAKEQDLQFAEIYISLETAMQQAEEHGVSLSDELVLLSIHGILHAIGFDHELSVEDFQIMQAHERTLLSALGLIHVAPLIR